MKIGNRFAWGAIAMLIAITLLAGCGSLMRSTYRNDVAGVIKWIGRGEDVNQTDRYRWAPLHWTAYYDYVEVTAALLEKGADPNCRTGRNSGAIKKGSTPLLIAAYYGRTETVRLLLTHKADPDIPNETGLKPLDYSKRSGFDEVTALLLGRKEYNPEKEIKNEMAKPFEQKIRLKDGRKIVGTIVDQTYSSFIVNTDKGNVTIEKNSVDDIRFK